MTREEVREKFMQDVLGSLYKEEYRDAQDTDTFEGLGLDSLDVMEVLVQSEKVFGLDIPSPDMKKSQTIGQAVGYLYKRQTI